MDRLIHISLSALKAAMAQQTVIANNLSNAATTGFRADMASAQAVYLKGPGATDRAAASEEVLAADMHGGTVVQTGKALDVALGGDALLAVQNAEGAEAYTRRGDLVLDASGTLTTGDGRPVMGDGGPISLPPVDSIRINPDGTIWAVPSGGDPALPQQVDRLKLVSPQGSAIVKHVDGLFGVRGGGTLPADPDAKLTSGALEGSNVNTSAALVQMIEAQRSWDTQIKLLTTARDMDSATTNLMRLPN